MFKIVYCGQSIIYFVLYEVVYAINNTYKSLISWLEGDNLQIVTANFKTWFGLLFVQGAIDRTHVSITNPSRPFDEDYFYHKIGGYNIIAQAIVDIKKKSLICLLGILIAWMTLEHWGGLHCIDMHNIKAFFIMIEA